MNGPDLRKTEWLFGRIAAKDAVRALWHECHGERLLPADMEIEPDARGRPVARRLGRSPPRELPEVSISHAGGVAAALAAFGQRVGIDLEPVRERGSGFEEIAFDAAERELLDRFGPARAEGIARFWCAREAVAKALGCGQVGGPRSLAVRDVDPTTGTVSVALGPLLAAEHPDLGKSPLAAFTLRDADLIVAVSFLERDLNVNAISHERIMTDLAGILRNFHGREYYGDIGPGTRFFGDLGLASIDAVVLGETIEEHYGQKLPFHEFMADLGRRGARDIELGDLAGFLGRHLNCGEW